MSALPQSAEAAKLSQHNLGALNSQCPDAGTGANKALFSKREMGEIGGSPWVTAFLPGSSADLGKYVQCKCSPEQPVLSAAASVSNGLQAEIMAALKKKKKYGGGHTQHINKVSKNKLFI